jgi:hypothetical protein
MTKNTLSQTERNLVYDLPLGSRDKNGASGTLPALNCGHLALLLCRLYKNALELFEEA